MLYVFDLDGVLYRMNDPVPGAAEALERLRGRGDGVRFLTNNSSRTRLDYAQKLTSMGIAALEEEVMTSAYALGRLFQQWGDAGKSVYIIGEVGLVTELESAGMRTVPYEEDKWIDFVVVGWDRQFTYRKLADAHLAVASGARFIATNRDPTYPDAGGRTLPGSGSLVASLVTCSGKEPLTIGKPERYTLELLLKSAGVSPQECTVVGDRLDTDIALGKNVGTKTALVLTGVHTRADVDAAPPSLRPDYVWESLAALP